MEQIVLIGGQANGSVVYVETGVASYYQIARLNEGVTIERYVRILHERENGRHVFRHQFMTGEVE